MTRNRYILQLLTLLVMILSGCQKELIEPKGNDDEFVAGEPVVINVSFNAPKMDVKTRADIGKEMEESISSIAVFVFDSKGELSSQVIHETAGVHSSSGNGTLSPNGTDKIQIQTLPGNNCTIFAIANYHSNLIEGLRSVATVADMNTLIINMLGNPLFREFGICKIAEAKVNIRNNSTIPMVLKYVSAKVTVNVTNKSSELTVTGWSADQIPLKSYIVGRAINSSDLTYHDAGNPLDGGDFYSDFADQIFPFEKLPTSDGAGSVTDPKSYSSTFYMFENRRGARITRELPSGWPTPATKDTDPKLKAWFAPKRASIIKVFGRTNTVIDGSKTFTLNHYLGANNFNDYNVNRGTHYTYNITINGLNNIHIDTNIEQYDLNVDIRPPADTKSLDAHATTRPFMLHTNTIVDSDVKISAEVLEAIGSDKHPEWLDLTTSPLISQYVRSSDADIALWQQDGAEYSYVRPKFIPNKATRTALGSKFTAPAGVIIGFAEYPDDDTTLDYDHAHHRMCKQITDIPTAVNGRLNGAIPIYMQSSEFEYTNTKPYREAVIRFTFSRTGQIDQHTTFLVRQYPPYYFTNTPDATNDIILVERIEEYEHTTDTNMPISLQMNAGMQWGKYDLAGANKNLNGQNNTLLGIYDTNGNYLKKYGSLSGKWKMENSGEIAENNTIPTVGAPLYNHPTASYNNAHNTVYNTTAARYCHEKNSDLNGDGNIDASETFWYLPAVAELQLFWTYHEVIKMKPDFYWSSTQTDTDKAYAISMLNEASAAHLTYSGTVQPLKKDFVTTIGPPRVRCVRRKAASTGVTAVQPMVSHLNNGTTVIDCSNLPSTMYTNNSKNGIKQGNTSSVHNANKLFFKKFEVQNKENSEKPDYSSLHFGNGKCDHTKGWRLPTQREMLLIFSVRGQLESGANFEKFENETYWTMSRDLDAHYVVDFSTGLANYGKYFEATNTFRYRCIKELK